MSIYRMLAAPPAASLIWCGLIAVSSAADDDHAARQVELKKGDRIIFFGDSLTSLAGDDTPKQHVTKGYVRIVRETLQAAAQGQGSSKSTGWRPAGTPFPTS